MFSTMRGAGGSEAGLGAVVPVPPVRVRPWDPLFPTVIFGQPR